VRKGAEDFSMRGNADQNEQRIKEEELLRWYNARPEWGGHGVRRGRDQHRCKMGTGANWPYGEARK